MDLNDAISNMHNTIQILHNTSQKSKQKFSIRHLPC